MARFTITARLVVALFSAALATQTANAQQRTSFIAERGDRLAALANAAYATQEESAALALAQWYWDHGLLPEAAGALAATPAGARHQLTPIIAVARGLAPPHTLTNAAQTDPLAAFVQAGRTLEQNLNARVDPNLVARARQALNEAPSNLTARFAPALTHVAIKHDTIALASAFMQAAATSGDPGAAAFAKGRLAERNGDLQAARGHYADATPHRGPWSAEARLRTAALDWAAGDATPSQTAARLRTLVVDWNDAAFVPRALLALARAESYAGSPDRAADALALVVERHAEGPHAINAERAAMRLDALFAHIFVDNRFAEWGPAARLELYARTRRYAATPIGQAPADLAHLDALLAAGLAEEVITLTSIEHGWAPAPTHPAFARRLRAQLLLRGARAPTLIAEATPPAPPAPAARFARASAAQAAQALSESRAGERAEAAAARALTLPRLISHTMRGATP